MAARFVDTSALAKRYVNERGSAWLRGELDPGTGAVVFLVRITAVELVAALTRRERGGSLTAAAANAARATFRRDLKAEYRILEVTEMLADRAMALAETHALRGYDAVQLAAAVELGTLRTVQGLPSLLFLSSDTELLRAAVSEGLTVDDPNAHP